MSTTDRPSATHRRTTSSAASVVFECSGRTKIQAHHRERLAVVYVRQSTQRQVLEHVESTALQYQLTRRAVGLGWPDDRVLVIDDDLGQSARSATQRAGFQRLLAELSLSHVGMVLGIDMSRLARSCKDWYQLLELCALFGALLADQDGVYDPGEYNDRLLLGLKGTMSEAELHIMRNRLDQGRRHKAERGELFTLLPTGYVRLPSGEVTFDPDLQVQTVIRLVFDKFAELGSGQAVVRYLCEHQINLPLRPNNGLRPEPLVWRAPSPEAVYDILNHPIFAGAYAYGRHPVDPQRKQAGQSRSGRVSVPAEEWQVLRRDQLPAYITWERYLANREQLRQNTARWNTPGVPRSGAALLSGLIYCERCGYRRRVHYRRSQCPGYSCSRPDRCGKTRRCPDLPAAALDALVSRQVLEALQPAALELSLRAHQDIERERERLHQHWQQQLERARYQVERAQRQYDAVEPENRLVASVLEKQWDKALTQQRQLEEDYARFRSELPRELSSQEREAIQSLANDLPQLWDAPTTTPADRQAIIRQLVSRVSVQIHGATEIVRVTIHWKGDFVSQHEIHRTLSRYEHLQDYAQLRQRLAELRGAGNTSRQMADRLNAEGFHLPKRGGKFTAAAVRTLLSRQGLSKPRGERFYPEGCGGDEWWLSDLARELGVSRTGLSGWAKRGWVHARQVGAVSRYWIIWADRDELTRLRRLRDQRMTPFPPELTTPKPRPKAKASRTKKRR
jgi:DNA invertase Pin-like site-specific DNA recombinase